MLLMGSDQWTNIKAKIRIMHTLKQINLLIRVFDKQSKYSYIKLENSMWIENMMNLNFFCFENRVSYWTACSYFENSNSQSFKL